MRVHLLRDGEWSVCRDATCELVIHLPDMLPAQAAALPLVALLPIVNVLEPPTIVRPNGDREWLDTFGRHHRNWDLPAVINGDGTLTWYWHGSIHRPHDRPARIQADGTLFWYANGLPHRANDLPAVVATDGMKAWYKHNRLHRDNGQPAIVLPNGADEWWVEGVQVMPPVA